jgi:FkbM family methyltransferase
MARNIAKATVRRPRGFDLFHDLRTVLGEPKVIFDVGANVGQSARKYLKEFAKAQVYSFEPVAQNYAELVANLSSARFKPVNLALGAQRTKARMDITSGRSDMFQISEAGTEPVEVSTIDDYWGEPIDFLKIDTEGYDLEVLKGAERALREKRVGAVQVEAGMNPMNQRHVPFETFKIFFEERDYMLFAFYDQVEEFFTGEMHLRRTNPVFIPRRA